MKKGYLLYAAIVALVLAIGAVAYYVHAVKSLEVRNLHIKRVEDVTYSGMTLYGQVDLYNPSLVSISYGEIDLRIIFKESGKVLGEGSMDGGKIGPRSMVAIGFWQDVKFGSLFDVAVDVMASNETIIVVQGNVPVKGLGGTSLPFSVEYDINKELKEYVGQQAGGIGSILGSLFG